MENNLSASETKNKNKKAENFAELLEESLPEKSRK